MFAKCIAAAALLLAGGATAIAQQPAPEIGHQAFRDHCKDWDEWGKPAPPFKIHGGTYYVGTCGLAAILITTDEGHILIDGASRDGGPLVAANIERLGFDPKQIKILMHSHEHFDHVGGLAHMQEISGAKMVASHKARNALESGEMQADDPQFGMDGAFAPIIVASTVGDGGQISLGHITLTALETPGHTPGALSWQWEEQEAGISKRIVYADSLSPVSAADYRFSAQPEYIAAYRMGLARLAAIGPCLLITPHPSASWMLERIDDQGLGHKTAQDCRTYAEAVGARLDQRLADEASE